MILKSEKVILQTTMLKHVPFLWKWIQDKKVTKYMNGAQFPKTYAAEVRWFKRAKRKKHEMLFVILDAATQKPIGAFGIHQISHEHRKATVGIMIGEKAYWSRGFGTDAMKTALCYCFKKLKLNKVGLSVDVENKGGLRCYRRCGFKKVGYLKDDVMSREHFRDSYLMEVFAKDFLS